MTIDLTLWGETTADKKGAELNDVNTENVATNPVFGAKVPAYYAWFISKKDIPAIYPGEKEEKMLINRAPRRLSFKASRVWN
jgi:hypothetical protein